METSVATARVAEPPTSPAVAVMSVLPAATAFVRPAVPDESPDKSLLRTDQGASDGRQISPDHGKIATGPSSKNQL